MFKEIYIKNYKSIKSLNIPLTKINVFIGPNNSGKTSILEAIMLMKWAIKTEKYLTRILDTPFENNIEFEKLVFGQKEDKIELGYTVVINNHDVKRQLSISYRYGNAYSKIIFNNKVLEVFPGVMDHRLEKVLEENTELGKLKKEVLRFDKNIFFIPSMRGLHRMYIAIPEDLVAPSDAKVSDAFDILYFVRDRTKYRKMIENINSFLKKYNLDDIRTIPAPKRRYEVVVRDIVLDIDINISQIGFGINQLIQMLILLNYYPDQSLVLIEQPEIHMHPRLQTNFVDLLLHILNVKKHQLLVETHSEHIIYSILNLIAKKEIKKSDVNIFYVTKEKSETKCKLLEITERGTIIGGLPGFFEVDIENLIDWLSEISKE
ncbi:MAG: AAA family ATPase [Candidatus Asgardarchaeia archaeon]